MNVTLFNKFCDIAYSRAGIRIQPGKEALLNARVGKRLRCLGLDGHRQYLDLLEKDHSGDELRNFLNVITTNYTFFFREPDHFEYLRQWVGAHCVATRPLRVWSAACSSGEEPYSLAISLLDHFDGRSANFKILATDISTNVLTTASAGRYDSERLEPLSRQQLARYCKKLSDGTFEIKPAVRRHVIFRRLNLSTPPFPIREDIDVIFLRNAMIYFDKPVRQRVVSELERLLRPGGVFIIGHSETLAGIDTALHMVRPSVYEKPGGAR